MNDFNETVYIIGGFGSIIFYYLPLKKRLEKFGIHATILSPGRFGLNIWPLCEFEERIFPLVEASPGSISLIGHSLGGIQAMWVAFNYPQKVNKVIAICSPVKGSPIKIYESMVLQILDVPKIRWDTFQLEGLRVISSKIVTFSSSDDLIAPTESCIIEGAKNYQVQTINSYFSPSPHIIIPFLASTAECIAQEIKSNKEHVCRIV